MKLLKIIKIKLFAISKIHYFEYFVRLVTFRTDRFYIQLIDFYLQQIDFISNKKLYRYKFYLVSIFYNNL